MPVPVHEGGQSYPGFIKLPNPLENKTGDIAINDIVTILTVFDAPTNAKIQSKLVGDVELSNGEKKTVGLNWNSYYNIAKVLGDDTDGWVGKQLKYLGMKKFNKGTGHLWGAA